MKRLLVILVVWLSTISGAQAAVPWPEECIQPIAIGQTVRGQLTTNDCAIYYNGDLANLYYTDVYRFNGTAGQRIAIQMNSVEVDAWLELYDVNDVQAT